MDTQKKSLDQNESLENEKAETTVSADNEEDFLESSSTVFAKSQSIEARKSVSPKKKRIITVVSMILAVLVIATSIFLVTKYVGNDEEEGTEPTSIKVKTVGHQNVSKITIKNQNGEFTVLPKTVEGEEGEELHWYIDGVNNPLISETMVGTVTDNCLYIYATREMKDTSLDYGFDKPFATISVTTKNGLENFEATIGNMSPDKTGYYLKASGDEKIYLITAATADYINFTLEDLSEAIMLDPVKLTDETKKEDKKYFDSDGNISTFDFTELSGTKYGGEVITLTPIEDNAAASYNITTKEGTRFANSERCESVFGILKNGLVAVEVYKLSPTNDDLKTYGLLDPEYTVKIKYGTNIFDLKATLYDEEKNYYAVTINGKDAIYAMSADALDMIGFSKNSFYNEYVFLEYYNVYSSVVITTENGKYEFKTEYNENVDADKFVVYANGKKVDGDLFSAYYEHIVDIAPKAEENYIKGEPSYKAVFTFNDKSKGTKTLTLTKQSDRRYLVSVDSVDMGIVTSRVYDNLTDYVQNIINGKEIPTP